MTSSNGNIFSVTGPLWGESTGDRHPPVTSEFLSQRLVKQSFDFSLICAWTNDWANNRDTGDLTCHHDHYDITAMRKLWCEYFGKTECILPRLHCTFGVIKWCSFITPSRFCTILMQCNKMSLFQFFTDCITINKHWNKNTFHVTELFSGEIIGQTRILLTKALWFNWMLNVSCVINNIKLLNKLWSCCHCNDMTSFNAHKVAIHIQCDLMMKRLQMNYPLMVFILTSQDFANFISGMYFVWNKFNLQLDMFSF